MYTPGQRTLATVIYESHCSLQAMALETLANLAPYIQVRGLSRPHLDN